MKKSEVYKKLGVLDLAVEAHDIIRGETGREVNGVLEDVENLKHAKVTTITIKDPMAEKIMGRPRGTYITIDAPEIRQNNRVVAKEISQIFAQKLTEILKLNDNNSVLLVGLGNWHATPDALGPTVVEKILVTRHLHQYAPEELIGGLRSVSAISPGVLGITGIETAEIIKGVVEKSKPDLIIVIDSLAAASVDRIASTIQMADTGISPGSGLGNKRAGINQETMGVRVIAIGVPTVVHAGIIASSAIDMFMDEVESNPNVSQLIKNLNPIIMDNIMNKVMEPYSGNLVVTPKEIDDLINNTAMIIADGINQALHPAVNPDDFALYLQ